MIIQNLSQTDEEIQKMAETGTVPAEQVIVEKPAIKPVTVIIITGGLIWLATLL